jgi:hypothetical protein
MTITIGAHARDLLKRRKMVKVPTNWGIEREKPSI